MGTPSKDKSAKSGFGKTYSIRFSAAAAKDDDDLDWLEDDSAKSKQRLQFEMMEPDEVDRGHSLSAPVSEVTTPVVEDKAPASQPLSKSPSQAETLVKEELAPVPERSLLSGIRERLPDQLTAFIEKKIEELSSDNSEEKREKKLQKMESLDEKKLKKSESFEYVKNKILEKRDSFIASRTGHSRNASIDSNASNGETPTTSDKNDKSTSKSSNSSFEIVTQEDFFAAEPYEDFAGGLHTNSNGGSFKQTGSHENGKRSGLLNFMKSKEKQQQGGNGKAVGPVSLSGLLSVTDVDEDAVEATEDEFYDPKDDTPSRTEDSTLYSSLEEPSSEESKASNTQAKGTIGFKHKAVAIIVAVVAYLITPMPVFLSGLLLGGALTWTLITLHSWLYRPPTPREPFLVPDLKTLPPLRVPVMKESKNEENRFTVSILALLIFTIFTVYINIHNIYIIDYYSVQ